MTLLKVTICVFLSGCAALLYQVAWLRQFSIVFGTSEIAVATVLAAYMGGLALGSAITGRYLHRIRRPILTYGILEGGIALTALLVPVLLGGASAVFIYFVGGNIAPPASAGSGQTLFYLISTFLILGIPTGCMGATLPLLTKYAVRSDEEIGSRVSLLYAVNTAGAVAGALLAGFLVLPMFGLRETVWLGAIVNVFVFIIAYQIDKNIEPALIPQKSTPESISFKSQQSWILPIMAVSGAIAFTYEVLWTRLLNHVLGGSIYAFSTMLASFLAGIAIGSGIAGRFATDRQKSTMYFAASQVLVAVASISVFLCIENMLPESSGMLGNTLFAVAVMLPSTVFIGATFPLAVRILSRNEFEAGTSAANIYAWNTIGAIVGALLAGFYVIPELGFTGTIKAAALTNLFLALVTTFLSPARRQSYSYFMAAAIVAALLLFKPTTPNAVIRSSALPVPNDSPEKQLFFEVGRSSTVLLVEHGGAFTLRTNGLPEAQIFAKGAPPIRNTQKWLTALPVLARPDARTMLVIGFGGGVAIEGIPPSVAEVDVIELEPEVINANRTISHVRGVDPTSIRGVNIIINDARNALNLTSRRYDVIVSQPSHPWTAGASHLFTREFLQLSKRHLDEKGVFVQWMNSELLDASLLRSLVATLFSVFDHVRLYHPDPGVLFFVASDTPVNIEQQLLNSDGGPIAEYANHYSRLGLATVEDVLLTLAADEAGLFKFSQSAESVTDNNNLMATRSNVFGTGLTADELIELLAPYDPLLDRESWVFEDLEDIEFAYMTSTMLQQKFARRVGRLKEAVPDEATALLINAMELSHSGKDEQAEDYYHTAHRAKPYDTSIQYFLVRRYLGQLARGNAPSGITDISNRFSGVPAAVIQGWRHGLASNWRGIAQLDTELAKSLPSDPWYVDAALLRAEWRTKVVVPGDNRYAREAMSLVDRALLIGPSLDLYVLRATSAILLGDPLATVETVRYMAIHIQEMIDRLKREEYYISTAALEALEVRLNSFINEFDKPFYDRTDGANAEVRGTLEDLLTEIRAQLRQ